MKAKSAFVQNIMANTPIDEKYLADLLMIEHLAVHTPTKDIPKLPLTYRQTYPTAWNEIWEELNPKDYPLVKQDTTQK